MTAFNYLKDENQNLKTKEKKNKINLKEKNFVSSTMN